MIRFFSTIRSKIFYLGSLGPWGIFWRILLLCLLIIFISCYIWTWNLNERDDPSPSSLSVPAVHGLEFPTSTKSTLISNSCERNPTCGSNTPTTSISSSIIGGGCRNKSCSNCQIKSPCSHTSIIKNNSLISSSTSSHGEASLQSICNNSLHITNSSQSTSPDNNFNTSGNSSNVKSTCKSTSINLPHKKEQFEVLEQFESVSSTPTASPPSSVVEQEVVLPVNQLLVKGSNTNNHHHHQEFCKSSPGGSKDSSNAPGPFILTSPWSSSGGSSKDQQHLENCNRPTSTNCNQINMSSSVSCGVSSSSIFGAFGSGNTRRPSMFTAKYRMREERKKVLKMSLSKVKRIEDPESVLRRSVLINNTIKRLQKEIRDEKMMRHGGSYTSKLSSCSSYRKSFACSRLNEMHLSVVDEPDTPNNLLDQDDSPLTSRTSSSSALDNLVISKDHHNSPRMISSLNSRKRQLNHEDSEDDCDVLREICIPPTPCIISSIDEDDHHSNQSSDSLSNASSHHYPSTTNASDTNSASSSSDITSQNMLTDSDCSISAAKKPRLSFSTKSDLDLIQEDITSSLLTAVSQDCSLDDDVDVDVDVVGDSEMSDWPTPPLPPTSRLDSSMPLSPYPMVTSQMSLSLSSAIIPSSPPTSLSCSTSNVTTSCLSGNSLLDTSPFATGLEGVIDAINDTLMVDVPPVTRDSSERCPSPSLTVTTSSLAPTMPTIVSPSSSCKGRMSPLPYYFSGALTNDTTPISFAQLEQEMFHVADLPKCFKRMLNPGQQRLLQAQEDSSSSSSDEDMTLSSETKENTCSLPLSLPLSGLHSPLADRNFKCNDLNDSSSSSNINANSVNINNNSSNVVNNNNNNSMINSLTGSETDKQQQQYSSCGHSSIFSELQTVGFHSLIASMES